MLFFGMIGTCHPAIMKAAFQEFNDLAETSVVIMFSVRTADSTSVCCHLVRTERFIHVTETGFNPQA